MKNKTRSSNRLHKMLFSLFALLSAITLNAQTKTISGTVNGDGLPLPGVAISIKGKTAGTITDFDGNYSIEAAKGEVLSFSYAGFTTQNITVGESDTANVDLQVEISSLDEVVVVGYQKQKKSEVTGAISSIKGEELTKQATGNFAEALQGQVAGVSVQAASGAPGAKVNVQIRGANSLSTTDDLENNPTGNLANPLTNSTGPLWVVDGVPFQRDPNLSPSEIESVEVLKDAASTAIYGVRAAAGVILVTTKRGKEGSPVIELNTFTSINKITSRVPTVNTNEAVLLNFDFVRNNDLLGNFGQSGVFANNPNALDFNTDWQDLVLNDNALTFNANARFSGGAKGISYSLNIDHFDAEGTFKNTSNVRNNIRLNSSLKKGKFSVWSSLSMSDSNIKLEPWRILYGAISTQPYEPNPSGLNGISASANSSNALRQGNLLRALNQQNERNQFSASAYVSFTYNWFDGFNSRINFSANTFKISDRFFDQQVTFIDQETDQITNNQPAELNVRTGESANGLVEFINEYNKEFGNHKLSFLAGLTREKKSWLQRNNTVIGFPDNVFPTASRSTNTNESRISEQLTPNNLVSYLGTFGYGYKEKYLLRANFRRDGSSNFGPGNRFENFYGASVGWVVSKEGFFENSNFLAGISNLKFRASWGQVGNQNIQAFQTTSNPLTGSNVVLSDEIALGSKVSRLGNSLISWETSETTNFGLDLELFNGAVTFTGEIYEVKKRDLLLEANLPFEAGSDPDNNNPSKLFTNIGELSNKGLELTLGYRDIRGDFKWGINGTFTKNVNEITKLSEGTSQIPGGPVTPGDNRLNNGPVTFGRIGEPIGSFYLLKTNGIIRNQEELDEYKQLGGETSSAQIGDLRYVDSNGDGIINLDSDRVNLGAGVPDFETGLSYNMSYKNFDFNMQWFASFGSKVYNGPKALAYNTQTHRDLLFAFNPGFNEESNIPINRGDTRQLNYSPFSDLFLEDGDYIRLRNIQFGYSLPKRAIKELGLTRMRIYLAASNVLTITDYTGFDPEVGGNGLLSRGIDRGFTPVTGSGRIGVELTF